MSFSVRKSENSTDRLIPRGKRKHLLTEQTRLQTALIAFIEAVLIRPDIVILCHGEVGV